MFAWVALLQEVWSDSPVLFVRLGCWAEVRLPTAVRCGWKRCWRPRKERWRSRHLHRRTAGRSPHLGTTCLQSDRSTQLPELGLPLSTNLSAVYPSLSAVDASPATLLLRGSTCLSGASCPWLGRLGGLVRAAPLLAQSGSAGREQQTQSRVQGEGWTLSCPPDGSLRMRQVRRPATCLCNVAQYTLSLLNAQATLPLPTLLTAQQTQAGACAASAS